MKKAIGWKKKPQDKIIGIDETNFSPSLAGDCVVAAYIKTGRKVPGVKDSKKLDHPTRLKLFKRLNKEGLFYVVLATANNISMANSYRSRNIAIEALIYGIYKMIYEYQDFEKLFPNKVMIDGKWNTETLRVFGFAADCSIGYEPKVEGIIGGEDKVYEIGAASIISKVYTDALFEGWSKNWPGYGMEHDHGTPCKQHKEQLRKKGATPIHRTGVYGKNWWSKLLGESNK